MCCRSESHQTKNTPADTVDALCSPLVLNRSADLCVYLAAPCKVVHRDTLQTWRVFMRQRKLQETEDRVPVHGAGCFSFITALLSPSKSSSLNPQDVPVIT